MTLSRRREYQPALTMFTGIVVVSALRLESDSPTVTKPVTSFGLGEGERKRMKPSSLLTLNVLLP